MIVLRGATSQWKRWRIGRRAIGPRPPAGADLGERSQVLADRLTSSVGPERAQAFLVHLDTGLRNRVPGRRG